MITTSTGAKKLESSDNWREIFPNPGTSAAGAHNASVDAQDRIQAEVAPIINGKRCSLGAASGEYVLLRNSTIAGKTDGAYQATKAIPANTDLDSTYLGSAITGGISNALNNNITTMQDEGVYYGTCTTAATTRDKVVTCTNFPSALKAGQKLSVKFTYGDESTSYARMTVNSLSRKNIQYVSGSTMLNIWEAGEVVDFVYDGTAWIVVGGNTYKNISKFITPTSGSNFTNVALTKIGRSALFYIHGLLNITPNGYFNICTIPDEFKGYTGAFDYYVEGKHIRIVDLTTNTPKLYSYDLTFNDSNIYLAIPYITAM